MQSEMAGFTPVAATWQTGQNVRIDIASGPVTFLCPNFCHPQNRKYLTLRCPQRRT